MTLAIQTWPSNGLYLLIFESGLAKVMLHNIWGYFIRNPAISVLVSETLTLGEASSHILMILRCSWCKEAQVSHVERTHGKKKMMDISKPSQPSQLSLQTGEWSGHLGHSNPGRCQVEKNSGPRYVALNKLFQKSPP